MNVEWSGLQLPLSPRDISYWEKAEQAIEAHRCGAMLVRVVNAHGQPLPGVIVRYQQQKHSFRFGVHYPYHAEAYDRLQAAGINAATLWLGWKYVEPERGVYNWDYLDRVWNPQALHQRGLELTAHALNWFKPHWHVLPNYLYDVTPDELAHLAYEHVSEIARHWHPYIQRFELVNEPFWAEADGVPMTTESMVRLCHASALAIRDVNPAARLEINFAEVSRQPSYTVHPSELIAALDKAQVPYDTIGLQALENGYSVTEPHAFYRTKTFAGIIQSLRQYAGFGKALHISALAVPSVPPTSTPPTGFKLPYGPWDEVTQARYLDAAYTYLFAQPEVEGITWWSPVDGRLAFIAVGGLLRADLSPKPAYEALQQWIARHTSDGLTRTDSEGKAVLRGYEGEYEITIGAGAISRRLHSTIRSQIVEDETVVLTDNT
ncbi:MAG: hypothetical protein GX552_18810 [Chloroflexi bacterium]|nr:hypothetical protein [Chloroflexota bacterium]